MRTVLPRWALQFNARPKREVDAIEAFLPARLGVESFELVVPSSAWAVTSFPMGTGDGARTQYFLERPVAPEVPGEQGPATNWTPAPQVYLDVGLLSVGVDYSFSRFGRGSFSAAQALDASLNFTGKGARVARRLREVVVQHEGLQFPRRQRGG